MSLNRSTDTSISEILIFTLVLVALAILGISNAPAIAEPLQRVLMDASLAGQ